MSWSNIPRWKFTDNRGRPRVPVGSTLAAPTTAARTLDLITRLRPDMIWTRFACLNRMIISDYEFGQFCISICVILKPKEIDMAKGQQRSNREAKKPKKKKVKVIAAAPSQKGAGWQPTFADGKRK